MRIARSHFGAAAVGGKIYAIGGGGENFTSLNSVEIYDPQEDRWREGSPMPTTRSGVAAVVLEGKIWVMGGGFRYPDGSFIYYRKVELYDPKRDQWETGPELLLPHDYPAAAAVSEKIYLVGGHHPDVKGSSLTDPGLAAVEEYDEALGVWRQVPPMPTPRFAASALAVDGRLWVFGGCGLTPRGFANYDLIEIYDPRTRKWSSGPKLPWPFAGGGGVQSRGKVLVVGGMTGERVEDGANFMDGNSGRWAALSPLPEPRVAASAVSLDGTLFVFGGRGADGKKPVKSNYCLEVA